MERIVDSLFEEQIKAERNLSAIYSESEIDQQRIKAVNQISQRIENTDSTKDDSVTSTVNSQLTRGVFGTKESARPLAAIAS